MQQRAPRLNVLAEQIMREFPDLYAVVYPKGHPQGGYCNTDRKIGRLRSPGVGRYGSRLVVTVRPGHDHPGMFQGGIHGNRVVLNHNAAETYRANQDVVNWIDRERARRRAEKRKGKREGSGRTKQGRGTQPVRREGQQGGVFPAERHEGADRTPGRNGGDQCQQRDRRAAGNPEHRADGRGPAEAAGRSEEGGSE